MRRNRHYRYLTSPCRGSRWSSPATSATRNGTLVGRQRARHVRLHAEALKLMQPQKYGRIINIASLSGMSGLSAHSPHYSATKGAVIAFTKAVAAEVAGSNISVNVVAPGLVHTQELEAILQKMDEEARNRFWPAACPPVGSAPPRSTPPPSCTWRASTTWSDRSFRLTAAC